jgi:hypothetical protein
MVEVRLSGDPDDIKAPAAGLAACCIVLSRRGPYPNRRDPGVRACLTIRPGPPGPAGPGHRA